MIRNSNRSSEYREVQPVKIKVSFVPPAIANSTSSGIGGL
jgi:hypothetical protein